MRTFFMTLAALGCLAASGLCGDDLSSGGDFVAPLLARVEKMSPAEQQAWLEAIERRADRAARLTLSADEATKHQAEIASLLHRELVTWSVLRDVLEDTRAREQETIDLLARRYRRQVAETFGKRLDQQDRRQDAWTSLDRAWTKAGGPFEGQERLIAWLEAAIEAARPKHVAAIPEPPKFAPPPSVEKPQAVAKAETPRPKQVETPRKPPERRIAAKPIVEPTEPQPKESVEINLNELAARIAGSNLGFRTLESELDEKGPWNAERLEPLTERLKVLVVRRNDLALFRDLAPAGKQASLGGLTAPKSAIAELSARIADARKAVEGDDFQGTDAERRKELKRLDALSRQLADLANRE